MHRHQQRRRGALQADGFFERRLAIQVDVRTQPRHESQQAVRDDAVGRRDVSTVDVGPRLQTVARLGDERRRGQSDDGAETTDRRQEHPGKEPVALPGGVHPRQRVRDRRRPQERLCVAGARRPAAENARHALRPRHVAAVRRQAEQGDHGVDRQVDQDLEPRQHP